MKGNTDMAAEFTLLENRGLIRARGPDTRTFLQGLISNDVNNVSPSQAIYAAFLTPQGKYLYDFFVAEIDGTLYLDCEAARLDEFLKRLKMFKLRADVDLSDASDQMTVAVIFGDGAAASCGLAETPGTATGFAGGVAYTDPRLAAAGVRTVLPAAGAADALAASGAQTSTPENYDAHRLALGLPDGSRDMVIDKAILLESGFEELNGVDWNKGCYMGQELTARTKYRGLVKKRLLAVAVDGPLPEPGTQVTAGGKDAGEIRSGRDGRAIALLKLEAVANGEELTAGNATLRPDPADWVVLQEAEDT